MYSINIEAVNEFLKEKELYEYFKEYDCEDLLESVIHEDYTLDDVFDYDYGF